MAGSRRAGLQGAGIIFFTGRDARQDTQRCRNTCARGLRPFDLHLPSQPLSLTPVIVFRPLARAGCPHVAVLCSMVQARVWGPRGAATCLRLTER